MVVVADNATGTIIVTNAPWYPSEVRLRFVLAAILVILLGLVVDLGFVVLLGDLGL